MRKSSLLLVAALVAAPPTLPVLAQDGADAPKEDEDPGEGGQGEADAARGGPAFFPLGEGRRWHYAVSFEVRPAEEEDPEGERDADHSLLVYAAAPQEVDGREASVLEWKLDRELSQRSFFVVEDGAVKCIKRVQGFAEHMKDFALEPAQTVVPAQLEVGQAWEWQGQVGGVPGRQSFEVLRRERVETPAGTFDAFVLEIRFTGEDDSRGTTTRWLTPGVGIVKDVSEVRTALSVFRTEGVLTHWERED